MSGVAILNSQDLATATAVGEWDFLEDVTLEDERIEQGTLHNPHPATTIIQVGIRTVMCYSTLWTNKNEEWMVSKIVS